MLKKSLKSIVILFLVSFLLLGCYLNNNIENNDNNAISDNNTINENNDNDENNEINDNNENNTDNLIFKSKELIVRDIAEEFIINAENLATYKYIDDPNVSYVNISEFITFMDGGIVDLNISKNDIMTISYTFDVPSEFQHIYGESYTYKMTLDPTNEVISYNDFDMVSVLTVPTISQYETEISLSNVEITDDDPSLDINLSLYGMDIVLLNEEYYIPLYLANLFFTGSLINVYEMNDYIYVIDDSSDLDELINNFEKDDSISASDISSHTNNYLALYFDYFYGLKNYKNIDTYLTLLENFNFEEKDDFNSLHKELENFIASQDDLHTSLISAGYMDEDYSSEIVNGTRFSNYLDAYKNHKCYTRNSEVYQRNFLDALVVEVNAFSLETKDLLKPIMEQAKNYDNIIIDVSCNTGGNLVGVLELLSYMTDKEIQLSYLNSTTGLKSTEYYQTTSNTYLDKNFYVYTSAVTFSAANLFASIVKDQELGIIFGENTSGGASAITYTVLPDGAIIVNSSTMTLINKDGEVIEDGIEVDINYNYPFSWDEVIDYLINLFASSSEISINKDSTIDSIIYDFNIDRNSEIINITDYKLSVYDYKTNKLLYEELFTSDDFTYMINKLEGNLVYKLELSVRYNVQDIEKEEIIYTDVIDDHSNTFDLNSTKIPIGEEFSAYSHHFKDKDAFKFSVLEDGLYRIELNENQKLNYHSVYDEDGNLIGEGFDFQLASGNYYLVASIKNIGEYHIKIRKLIDDNTEPTIINLQNGIQHHKLYYDYIYDDETFEFNIAKESMVTFSWAKDYNYEYSIKKSNGDYFSPQSDRMFTYNDITIIMPKGTYIVKLNDDFPIGEINLTTTVTTNYVDYSGDTSLESNNYGELFIGTNTMEFLTLWDQDVYYIDITESGSYVFEYDLNKGIVNYINLDGTFKKMCPNYYINLTPGRHYFIFEGYDFQKNPTIDFELIRNIDLNNENNMETIYLDQEISTIISNSIDVDYFEFYSSEMKTYKMNISGSIRGVYTIFDSEGNRIANNSYNTFLFTVTEGTYIIEVEGNIYVDRREKINMLITETQIQDEAVNSFNLPIEYYNIIEMDFVNNIRGEINYDSDMDVYIIYIKVSGNYKLYLYGDLMRVYCVDELGKSQFWSHGYRIYLEAGTYYLGVTSPYDGDYVIAYEKDR